MNEPSWDEAIRQSQANMRTTAIKRFYELVSVGEAEGGFAVLLDGRAARTPAKAKLILPTRALAEALAGEWAGQGETLAAHAMPLTRLANSAIDGVAQALDAVREEIAGYAGSDLLCYRAIEPERLVEMQRDAWDPVLAWAEAELGGRFVLSAGVVHVAQPANTLAAARAAIFSYESPFAVAALHGLTSLSGSALLALAVARGALGAEEAWRAAHVDEDYQISFWGEDEEAALRRAARWREFEAADATLKALG
jgi:chaperone required for assembly of F1-ATPase